MEIFWRVLIALGVLAVYILIIYLCMAPPLQAAKGRGGFKKIPAEGTRPGSRRGYSSSTESASALSAAIASSH